jgi:hypothetical protein
MICPSCKQDLLHVTVVTNHSIVAHADIADDGTLSITSAHLDNGGDDWTTISCAHCGEDLDITLPDILAQRDIGLEELDEFLP